MSGRKKYGVAVQKSSYGLDLHHNTYGVRLSSPRYGLSMKILTEIPDYAALGTETDTLGYVDDDYGFVGSKTI